MKKENTIVTLIKAFIGLFIKRHKETEKRMSDDMKREMCMRAIQSGVCPHTCGCCAWNVGLDLEE